MRVFWAALLLFALLPGQSAQAQARRAILWVVETAPDADVDRELVAALLAELLEGADDSDHIVDLEGLAAYIDQTGFPVPDCLRGLSPCPDPALAVAEELRLDVVAQVRVFGRGERMELTVRGVAGGPTRTLEFADETLRETAFEVVTDFVGASGRLTIASRPTGARVLLNGESSGVTPLQAQLPADIYRLRVELDGYTVHEQVVELRPNQQRLVEVELERRYVALTVRSTTTGATVYLDESPLGAANQAFNVEPGVYTLRVEAPGHSTEERELDLAAGSDRLVQVDLRESPEAIRARRMGYIYDRPFFFRGGFRFVGTRTSFSGAEGSVSGQQLEVACLRDTTGACSESRAPVNAVGLDLGLGYSFKVFEVIAFTFAYQASQIGGSSGDGREFNLALPGSDADGTLSGRINGIQRLEVRPPSLGVRLLLTDTWALFGHGSVGWYREFFDVEDVEGLVGAESQVGDFSRTGWYWLFDAGARYHLNDTLFVEGSVSLGNDFTHGDSDLMTVFGVGLGVTWEDFLGINRIGGNGGDEDTPPQEL